MDIKIRCPHCETKLVVEDELIGQSVLCEECNAPFPVGAPTAKRESAAGRRGPRPRDDDRETDYEFEFDDDRPIRSKARAKPNALVPMIFGGSLVFAMALIAVGLFFAFGFNSSGGSTPLPPGAKFKLSNPRWLPNQGFSVEIETADGRPPSGGHRVVWRSLDERSSGHATLRMLDSQFTQIIASPRGMNQSFAIWIEAEPPRGGAKLSNVVTLR